MMQRLLIGTAAVLAACGGNVKPTEAPVSRPVVDVAQSKPMPESKKNPVDIFFAQCREGLHTAQQSLPGILAVKGARTIENTLEPYNDVLTGLSQSGALAGL